MRKMALFTLAAALLAAVCFVLPPAIQAQGIEGILDCAYPDAEYYQAGVFPRYEAPGQRVVLVSWLTGADVLELETAVEVERFYGLGWSEDCRYVAVSMGSPDSLDTVVYDVAEARRVGSVPDAHRQPHAITWGPEAYLVVETRSGGILWDVAANRQTLLTTAWNTTTVRNFSRLRWDAEHSQLIANLAVGGRVVYDLATGQELDVAANVFDQPASSPYTPLGQMVVGGRPYQCQYYTYRYADFPYNAYANSLSSIYPSYDEMSHVLYLGLWRTEVVQVVEEGIQADGFRYRGWSASCRYFAGSLDVPGEDASDTVVWDIVENRRVGVFPDARLIDHPIFWSSVDDALVIETREGAYLWYLPTDRRTLLTTTVETALAGRREIRSFSDLQWNRETGQLFVVPLDAPSEVRVYDPVTGALLGTYAAEDGRVPAALLPFPVSRATIPPATAAEQVLLPVTPVQGLSGNGTRGEARYYQGYGPDGWQSDLAATCGSLTARYEFGSNRRLVIRDKNTDEVLRVLGEDMNAFYGLFWSPDCRLLGTDLRWVSNVPEPYDSSPLDDSYGYTTGSTLIFWDATTGARLREFPHYGYGRGKSLIVSWSPAGDWALIRMTVGFFIWHPASDTVTPLTFKHPESLTSGSDIALVNTYWDYARGQLLVSGWDAVYAFALLDGTQRYAFTHSPLDDDLRSCGPRGCHFSVAEDRTTLFVGTGADTTMGVWNLDTLERLYLDVENEEGTFLGQLIAISPDHRYVAMVGYVVRVWDLTAELDESGILPVAFRFDGSQIRWSGDRSIRFADNTTVETADVYENVQRWDILTGVELPVEAPSE